MDKTKRKMIDELYIQVLKFFEGDPMKIQHFAKVHSFAALIGRREGLSEEELFILEAAALVHDVGIPPAEKKYGSGDGKYQELEGPPVAREMLTSLDFPADVTERVAYLVGHHHTYNSIDGADYQILVEADFLVNLYEGGSSKESIVHTGKTIFRTAAGRALLCDMFGVTLG